MKSFKISVLVFLILPLLSFGQNVISLYNGLPPNSLPISQDDHSGKSIPWMTTVLIPTLITYLPEKSKANGITVIICPGGGYTGLAMDHEGHAIAKKLQENGIAGIVLKYRLPNAEFVVNKEIVPLQDAQRAIQYVREHASELEINANKVGIMGSSAGGHLASTAGTHFDKSIIENPEKTSLRPDFMVLNYPVISFEDGVTHNGSRYNLVGNLPLAEYQKKHPKDEFYPVEIEKIVKYSNDKHVNVNTPPTFIHSAIDDKVVPVENSLLFIAALQQHDVPVTSFFYEKGGHGYGLNNKTAEVQWIDKCIPWILNFK